MNLKYQYWYFNGVLPDRFCDLVLKTGLGVERHKGYIGNMSDRANNLTKDELNHLHKKDIQIYLGLIINGYLE